MPELKSLVAILWEWKEKDAEEPREGSGATQLGMIGLSEPSQSNRRSQKNTMRSTWTSRSMDDPLVLWWTGAETNIVTNFAATRLGLSYSPSNAHFRMVNAPMVPLCRVAQGVDITLGK